jgi:metal transporter CNNM
VARSHFVSDPDTPILSEDLIDLDDDNANHDGRQQDKFCSVSSRSKSPAVYGSSPKTTFLMRRSSTTPDGAPRQPVAVRGNANDLREHLKHLGPSNLASRPKSTRYNSVKIKPGYPASSDFMPRQSSIAEVQEHEFYYPAAQGGEGEGLLKSASREASDGVQAVQQGYGATVMSRLPSNLERDARSNQSNKTGLSKTPQNRKGSPLRPSARSGGSGESQGDPSHGLPSKEASPTRRKRFPARSGSITENYVDAGGVRKVVLETNSSSDDPDTELRNEGMAKSNSPSSTIEHSNGGSGLDNEVQTEHAEKKQTKRRRRRRAGAKSDVSTLPGGSGQ